LSTFTDTPEGEISLILISNECHMLKKENNIKKWSFAGTIVILVFGSILHFLYPWSGELKIIGLIAPVNESVWEHVKMGYWSLVLFSVFEYRKINDQAHNYFLSKLIGILALELTILITFYSYTPITLHSILWIDISSYVAGAIFCQFLSYQVQQLKPVSGFINRISLAGFISIGILLGITTYDPPHYDLFKDSRNNTYGINKEQ
jgi:Family of unknown function (DUF6512)